MTRIFHIFLFTLSVSIFACGLSALPQKIIATGDAIYPPLEYIDKDGNAAGFNVDVFKAVMEELGIDYEIRLMNWQDALHSVKTGSVDVFIDFGYSDGRARDFEFGQPHNYLATCIVSLKDSHLDKLDDLRNKEIILQKDEIVHNKIISMKLTDKYIFVDDALGAFKLLLQNKGDAFICNSAIASYYMKKVGDNRLIASQLTSIPALVTSFAIAKGGRNAELLAEMDAAERRLKQNGTYLQIYKKWFVQEIDSISNTELLVIITGLIILASAVFSVYIYRGNRRHEREKNLILNGIKIPAVLINQEGYYITSNDAFNKLHGMELRGKLKCAAYMKCPFGCKVPMTDNCIVSEVVAKRQVISREIEIRGRTYQMTCSPLLDKRGEVMYIVESLVDIDDLKRSAVSESMLNHFMINLITSDDHKEIIVKLLKNLMEYLDADYVYMCNYKDEKFVKVDFVEHSEKAIDVANFLTAKPLLREDFESWISYLSKVRFFYTSDLSTPLSRKIFGKAFGMLEYVKAQGIYCFGIFENGVLVGSCGIASVEGHREISQRDRNLISTISKMIDIVRARELSRKRLKKALAEALDAEKAKSYFLASMSHEIRTPLNSVIGFANLLKSDTELKRDTQIEYAKNISVAGNALLDLINDILDLSKLESGNFEILKTPTDFELLCNDLSAVFGVRIRSKNLTFKMDVPEMPVLFIDKQRVRQILFNLMSNAVKFTDSGGIVLKARFTCDSSRSGTLEFSIQDSGTGIPKRDVERIFKPFVQSDALRGTYAQNQGTGLGLAICKQMLDKMDGSISVESEFGKGSIFTVFIHGVNFEDSDTKDDVSELEHDDSFLSWQGKNVLLVDDVKMNLTILGALMKKTGAIVSMTQTPQDALELFRRGNFDVVLTDMWMPEMDGAQLAAMMKHMNPNVLIFAVTADVDSNSNFDMSAIDGVITKPVTLDRLVKLITLRRQNTSGGGG